MADRTPTQPAGLQQPLLQIRQALRARPETPFCLSCQAEREGKR